MVDLCLLQLNDEGDYRRSTTMSMDNEALFNKTTEFDGRIYSANAQQALSIHQGHAAAREDADRASSSGAKRASSSGATPASSCGAARASSAGTGPPASRWAKNKQEEFSVYNEKGTPVILRVSHAGMLGDLLGQNDPACMYRKGLANFLTVATLPLLQIPCTLV